jgi:hypothetical protein
MCFHVELLVAFVKKVLLMWRASSSSGNYQSHTNFKDYEKW